MARGESMIGFRDKFVIMSVKVPAQRDLGDLPIVICAPKRIPVIRRNMLGCIVHVLRETEVLPYGGSIGALLERIWRTWHLEDGTAGSEADYAEVYELYAYSASRLFLDHTGGWLLRFISFGLVNVKEFSEDLEL